MGLKFPKRFFRYPRDICPYRRAMLAEKVLGKCRYISPALSERRQMNRHDIKTIIEIFTEPSFLNETLQVSVSGGYDPDINGNGHNTANSFELTLLEKPQQLGLQFLRDIADLVKKDCAAMGQFDLARLAPVRAGKRALLVAEQLA